MLNGPVPGVVDEPGTELVPPEIGELGVVLLAATLVAEFEEPV